MKPRRTHPLTIVQFLFRYLYVLLIPVLKSLLELPFKPRPFSGFWMWELFAAGFIVLLAFLRWFFLTWQLKDDCLLVNSGLFFRKEQRILFGRISSADVERPLWLALFGAARLMADTPAKNRGNADLTLLLKKDIAFSLADRLCRRAFRDNLAASKQKSGQPRPTAYHTGFLALAVMAVTSSNAASGLLLAIPVVNHLGQVLGEELADRIYNAVDVAATFFSRILPPVAALLTALLAAGWIVAFVRTLFKAARLSAFRHGALLTVRGGLFFPRHSVLNVALIGAVDIRQGLLLRACSLSSVYLICAGYGKQKGEHNILIPAASREELPGLLRGLLPEHLPDASKETSFQPVRPPKNTLRRYLFWPILLTSCSAALCLLVYFFLPGLRFLLTTLAMALFLPCAWSFLFCRLGFSKAQFRLNDEHCVIGCMSHLKTHTLLFARSQIRSITLSRHPFQLDDDLCDVSILLFGAGKRRYTVKNLRRSEVAALLTAYELPFGPLRLSKKTIH